MQDHVFLSDAESKLWHDFCAWLEDRKYNACHTSFIPSRFQSLISGKNEARNRRYQLDLIMYQSGYGWRLRKNYREKLAHYDRNKQTTAD